MLFLLNKLNQKKRWDKYYDNNKEELLKKNKKRKNNNKEKYWNINNTYNNTEYGYIINLYSSALATAKKGSRHGKNYTTPFEFTKETWWEHWLKQKEKHGMKFLVKKNKTNLKKVMNNL